MHWPDKCTAVIPCFNEAAHIAQVVAGARAHVSSVIVVDDGSTDATAGLARANGAEVIRHSANSGKGAALKSGLLRAGELGFAWALVMDGDGQHAGDDIPTFLQRAETGDAALIIGNRMADTREMPWLRRAVNRWMSRRLSALAGQELPDTQCGFRLINLSAWKQIQLTTAHFEVESEMLIRFLAAGERIAFVPVRTVYKTGQSKIHPVRDTIRWFRWWRQARRVWKARRAG